MTNIIKRKFTLEIAVNADKILQKYPNYRVNFDDPNEFIEFILSGLEWSGDTNLSKNGMKKWGYSVKITPTA